MISSFPSPVLVVAADAVQELGGSGDALQGLWTLFTKCKSSVKNGDRLENATWRLWYRERSLYKSNPYHPPPKSLPSLPPSNHEKPAELRPTHIYTEQADQGLLVHPVDRPASTASSDANPCQPGFLLSLCSSSATPPAPAGMKRPRSSSLSKFILDILPSASSPSTSKSSATTNPTSKFTPAADFLSPPKSHLRSHPSISGRPNVNADITAASTLPHSNSLAPDPASQHPAAATLVCSTLPTPSIETPYNPFASIVSVPANTTAMLTIPAATFPRVVVVNPTPDPSPHPTPPATPICTASVASPGFTGQGHESTTLGAGTANERRGVTADARHVDEPSQYAPRTPQSQDERSTSVNGDFDSPDLTLIQTSYFEPKRSSPTQSLLSRTTTLTTSSTNVSTASDSKEELPHVLNDSVTRLAPPVVGQLAVPNRTTRSTKSSSIATQQPPSTKSADSTLKPSDRRFFLQQSPDADDGASLDSSSNGNGSLVDVGSQERRNAAPTDMASTKASSDISSSYQSNDSHVPNRPRSRASNTRGQRRAVGGHGKVAARAGGKGARPPISRAKSQSSTTFGNKLGMASTTGATGNIARTSSTSNVVSKSTRTAAAKASTSTIECMAPKPIVNGNAEKNVLPVNPAIEAGNGQTSKGRGKTMFNIGSGSSTASKDTSSQQGYEGSAKRREVNGRSSSSNRNDPVVRSMNAPGVLDPSTAQGVPPQRQPPPTTSQQQPPPLAATSNRKTIVVASTSSEYETESDSGDEDDSWASEEDNPDASHTVNGAGAGNQRSNNNRPSAATDPQARRLHAAALEAQRQRDMFVKVPQRSYSGILEKNRNKSGLLSQLMKPDPNIFPPGHPYHHTMRNNQSTQDFGTMKMANPLQTSKSAVTMPVVANVQVEVGSVAGGSGGAPNGSSSTGYRPKGRPQELEMEDDSDSDPNPSDKIGLSESVAHQKLAALAGRRSNASLNRVQQQQQQQSQQPQQPQQPQPQQQHQTHVAEPRINHRHSNPIPLGHPYNLPLSAAPSTPRTTRRLMLQTEMSESLRRNLLWERQVSKMNVIGARRTQSGNASTSTHPHIAAGGAPLRRHASGGMIGDSLRPLTTAVGGTAVGSIVQLVPKQLSNKAPQPLSPMMELPDERVRNSSNKKFNGARNRSWAYDASDFHTRGW